jgi:hypothetical protein
MFNPLLSVTTSGEGFTPYRNRSRKKKDRETKTTPDWPIRAAKRKLTA